MNPDQGGLQGIVDDTQFALCSVVQSFHQALLGFFPVTHLGLCQGNIVENLRAHTFVFTEYINNVCRSFSRQFTRSTRCLGGGGDENARAHLTRVQFVSEAEGAVVYQLVASQLFQCLLEIS